MDWTAFTLVIPIARWAKKQLDIAGRERRVAAREKNIAKRETEQSELIDLRKFNTEHISDLVFLKAERVDYSLSSMANIANIHVLITNSSIFEITLHKLVVQPQYEGQALSDISLIEERKIRGQSPVGFEIRYDLQVPTAERIRNSSIKGGGQWQFEMHGYFHSKVGDFEKQQNSSCITHP